MFTHIMCGTNDIAGAKAFYDAALGALGIAPGSMFGDTACVYQHDGATFIVTLPRDGNPATHANGGTLSFNAPSKAAVDAFHAAGLAHGGTCEGEPGPRPNAPGADPYGAYLRDPAGNKICAFHGLFA